VSLRDRRAGEKPVSRKQTVRASSRSRLSFANAIRTAANRLKTCPKKDTVLLYSGAGLGI
jgi:hypothetical protein